MAELNKMLDCMKKRAEETFEYYANKEKWEPQDLKCAKEATELYDKLQTIQMNNGIWEDMNQNNEYSFARYPHISYGVESFARGRDAGTGRFTSRDGSWDADIHGSYGRNYSYGDEQSYRGGSSYGDRNMSRGPHDGGYSTHSVKDQAIQRLEQLMDTAQSDYERQEIHKMIENIEKQPR